MRYRRQLILSNSLEVLNHCAKHGYTSLADEAANQAMGQSLDMVASKLTAPGVLATYVCFLDSFL
jgi:hypothetical protein